MHDRAFPVCDAPTIPAPPLLAMFIPQDHRAEPFLVHVELGDDGEVIFVDVPPGRRLTDGIYVLV